jgi:alpha-N-acetylglucosaminidase
MGLTMEGHEGNEVIYDILLDQAWSDAPLDAQQYFEDWVSSRYHGTSTPQCLYSAWDTLSKTVYNNTDLDVADAVTKSVFELSPNTTGIDDITGHHGTELTYDPVTLVGVWQDFYKAGMEEPSLWDDAAYTFDLTDITRQVISNAWIDYYDRFVASANRTLESYSTSKAMAAGKTMTSLLLDLDDILSASGITHFSLPAWIASARAWASPSETVPSTSNNMSSTATRASYYEYNARNQITLWGPVGQFQIPRVCK